MGLLGYSFYRLLAFACEFLAGRHDARQKRVDERERRADTSLENRLKHLERQEIRNRKAIISLEKLIRVLATELYRIDSQNPKLADVARVLNQAWDVDADTPEDMSAQLDKLP